MVNNSRFVYSNIQKWELMHVQLCVWWVEGKETSINHLHSVHEAAAQDSVPWMSKQQADNQMEEVKRYWIIHFNKQRYNKWEQLKQKICYLDCKLKDTLRASSLSCCLSFSSKLYSSNFFFSHKPISAWKSRAFVTARDGLLMTQLASTQPTCQSAHFERTFSSASFQLSSLHFHHVLNFSSLQPGIMRWCWCDIPSVRQIRVDCPQ